MWPFGKKPAEVPDIVIGDNRARFDAKLKRWVFEAKGVEFTLSSRNFDERAFAWAEQILEHLRPLSAAIDQKVIEMLDGSPCNTSSRTLLWINLDDYSKSGQADLAYGGDESWGDLGVNVVVADGAIISVYGVD